MKLTALSIGLVLVLASVCPAEPVTTLTVAEDAGVARQAEPITNGIPLPQGLVKEPIGLSLWNHTPAAFTVLSRWPADGSIRWVLLDTQCSVKAGGKLTLEAGPPLPELRIPLPLPGKLDVADAADTISVDTGVMKFTVRKKGFRFFESMTLGDTPILTASADGLKMVVNGVTFTSAADDDSSVTVEEKNAMRVALLAKGKLRDKDGKPGFDYEIRLHAYRNLPQVKAVVTVIKKYGRRDDAARASELSFELNPPPVLDENENLAFRYAFGSHHAQATGTLKKTAFVHAESSDSFKIGGDATGDGKCKSIKPLGLGWADISRADIGVAAGVRRFWQTCPKSIELSGDKSKPSMRIGLYPAMQKAPVEVYTGMARTHEILIVPHGKTTAAELQDKFIAFQRPLYAFPSPKWLCRDSGGLGKLAEVDPDGKLYAPHGDEVAAFDKKLTGILQKLAGPAQDNWTLRGVTTDAYGWLAYGDTLHHVWLKSDGVTDPPGSPWTIMWDANYYDMPHVALAHFARTGGREFFDFFVDHSWHLMDIDVVHWDPGFPNGGASRRCPATNHVGFDPPEYKSVTINVAFDHHKSESMFERYYFLGDRFALSTANELLQHAFTAKNPDYKGSGTRKPGHQVLTLVAGYWLTGDKKYLERARKTIDDGIANQKKFDGGYNEKVNFTDGICAEAFSKYYLATGEQDVFDSVKATCDFMLARRSKFGNPAMGFGLVYNRTGEEKYLKAGLDNLTVTPSHVGKDSADQFRNTADFLGLAAERLTGSKR